MASAMYGDIRKRKDRQPLFIRCGACRASRSIAETPCQNDGREEWWRGWRLWPDRCCCAAGRRRACSAFESGWIKELSRACSRKAAVRRQRWHQWKPLLASLLPSAAALAAPAFPPSQRTVLVAAKRSVPCIKAGCASCWTMPHHTAPWCCADVQAGEKPKKARRSLDSGDGGLDAEQPSCGQRFPQNKQLTVSSDGLQQSSFSNLA